MTSFDETVYRKWFPLADEDGDGRVTGGDAVKFFALSGLPKKTLARVWQLADSNRQGFLGVEQYNPNTKTPHTHPPSHPCILHRKPQTGNPEP
jgi:hypothetical protein